MEQSQTGEENYEFYRDAVKELLADGAPGKATVLTFGCQQNEADSEKLRGIARELGYCLTDDPTEANLILVNTCAIREHAEKRALSTVGQMKHQKAKDRSVLLGICGCMMAEPHRVAEVKKSYPYVDFTLDPASLYRLPEAIYRKLTEKRRQFVTEEKTPAPVEGLPVKRSSDYRANVSIMYGCNNFCSYCIVPYVRGRERSRDSGAILEEVAALVNSGCRDITLLGQNVNSYRSDCDFADLLEKLDSIPGDYILRFMTSHPKDVPDKLIDVMAAGTHIEPHFHLPVQSGSDPILKAMNRHYTREQYLSIVQKLREKVPGIVLTTDIIVGFPGETEEDFQATLRLLESVRYDMVFSFIYSPREGTPAARMPGQIPPEVAGDRMQRLLALQDDIAASVAQSYRGKTLRVLSDGVSRENQEVFSGRTDGGKLVHFTAPAAPAGAFLRVRIDRAEAFALYGTAVEDIN